MTTLAEKSQAGSRFTTSPLGRAHVVPRNRSAVAGMVLPRQENVLARTELAAAACCCNELALHGRLMAHFKQLQGLLPWPGTAATSLLTAS